MKRRAATLLPLACVLLAGIAAAQQEHYPVILNAKPMYKLGRPSQRRLVPHLMGSMLPHWSGSFTDHHSNRITYVMAGTNPATTNTTTTIPVYIVPVKMIYGKKNGNMTLDPVVATVSNGETVIKNVINSPIFKSGVDFTQGGTDLGATQYLDAFQRGNFWNFVKTNTDYHVLLKPAVLGELAISVTPTQGQIVQNPFGSGVVGTYDEALFDAKLQAAILKRVKITPGSLALFISYNTFLTQSGQCCVGGYHGSNGLAPAGQTYAYATYEDSVGSFAQDVSGISHEVGEWLDDPFPGNNIVACSDNSYLEVADPLVNNANYGAFPYTLDGFTYNLQSLVFLGYFGAPPSTSVHSWLSFQNDEASVCPGQ